MVRLGFGIDWIPGPEIESFFFLDGVYSVFWDFLLDTYLVIAELYKLLLNIFYWQVTTCWAFSI